MTLDYEILPLTQEYVDLNKEHGLDIELDEKMSVLKCFAKDGDLYRQTMCIIYKDVINTKEFVMLVHEYLCICQMSIKEAKKKKQ